MARSSMRSAAAVVLAASCGTALRAQDSPPADEAALRARIAEITVADVAWRQIPWKTCLLDGLATAQREKKPVLYWCQIDRPIDDTRC